MVKSERAYILFGIFALLYIGLTLWLPPDADTLTRYNLTPNEARSLRLSITIPYVIIWFFAFFGFVRLKKYSQLVNGSRQGKALSKISHGLFVLAIGLPIRAITSNLSSYIASTKPHLAASSTIIGNYLDIAMGLIAMTFMYKGALGLMSTINNTIKTAPSHLAMIAMALIGSSYTYLTFTNPSRQFPVNEGARAAYYLPDYLLLLTVVIPYLLIWYRGLHAAHYINMYRKDVSGLIYKKSLGYVATGIVFIVLSRVAMRYLTSLNTIVESWTLRYLLIVIYCLLILIAIGYGLVARGSEKLKKIEEA